MPAEAACEVPGPALMPPDDLLRGREVVLAPPVLAPRRSRPGGSASVMGGRKSEMPRAALRWHRTAVIKTPPAANRMEAGHMASGSKVPGSTSDPASSRRLNYKRSVSHVLLAFTPGQTIHLRRMFLRLTAKRAAQKHPSMMKSRRSGIRPGWPIEPCRTSAP